MSVTLDLHVVLSFQDVGVLCNLVTSAILLIQVLLYTCTCTNLLVVVL